MMSSTASATGPGYDRARRARSSWEPFSATGRGRRWVREHGPARRVGPEPIDPRVSGAGVIAAHRALRQRPRKSSMAASAQEGAPPTQAFRGHTLVLRVLQYDMVVIPESARSLLESGRLAHLVTTNRDGSPQISIVWVGLDGDEIVLAHLGAGQKIKNLERDPRVALSVEGTEVQPPGLQQYLVVHGTARITEGGGPQLLQELAHVYLGPDVKFPPFDDPPPGGSCTSPSNASPASAPGRPQTEHRVPTQRPGAGQNVHPRPRPGALGRPDRGPEPPAAR